MHQVQTRDLRSGGGSYVNIENPSIGQEHFLVITGISSDNDKISIHYNDPLDGEQKTYKWGRSFQNAWINNQDEDGGGWWLALHINCLGKR
jgi:hypothetical protein